MRKYTKYTKENLINLVKDSKSVSDVARKLGKKKLSGGSITYLSNKIKKFGIDTSHFKDYHYTNRRIANKKHWSEILVKKTHDLRVPAFRLRRSLIESGRAYACEFCHLSDEWNGKELRLQVDHINGDWLDNAPDNLRFLCPNCHSQTDGFNGSKGLTSVTKSSQSRKVKDNKSKKQCECGKIINRRNRQCKICRYKSKEKIQWPNYDDLKTMVESSSYLAVSRELGVSDNAVRKRLKNHKNQSDI